MKCPKCEEKMEKIKDIIEEDKTEFEAYRCTICGEEFLNIDQLGALAKKYREQKKREIIFAKWGNSIAVRIPKEFIEELNIKAGKHGILMKEKDGLKIILVRTHNFFSCRIWELFF